MITKTVCRVFGLSIEKEHDDALEWLADMCPIVASRWSGTIATTVMSAGAINNKKTGITESPASLSPTTFHRAQVGALIQKIYELIPHLPKV